ncbi:MAG: GTPase [Candidatus Woesearchaeota archaeon]
MNFQDLVRIEKYDTYLDHAFRKAKLKVEQVKEEKLKGERVHKSRQMESLRINVVKDYLTNSFQKILDSFPNINQLDKFYLELVHCTLEYDQLKLSLGILSWGIKHIHKFYIKYNSLINQTEDLQKINQYRREFYGRVSSIVKQTSKALLYLEEARKVMRNYPNIKTSVKTVSIVGFPNVGKTTLLYKLTGSKAEINSYSFTTKGINIGYIGRDKAKKDRIQVIDTPGTLNRFEKMNNIEKIAHLAMKYVSDVFIYVFDLSEEYPIDDQIKLFNELKKFDKKIFAYLSKTDILEKEKVEEFNKKINCIKDVKVLEKEMKNALKDAD